MQRGILGSVAGAALLGLGVLSCKPDDSLPTQDTTYLVKYVVIAGPNPDTVRKLGPIDFSVSAYNAQHVQVPNDRFTLHFQSLDPDTVRVPASNIVTAVRNGTARVVATAGDGADTVTVVVAQAATDVFFEVDTAVGLTADAFSVDTNPLASLNLRYAAFVSDANRNPIPDAGRIAWSSLNDTIFTIRQNVAGDTVTLHGVRAGLGFARAVAGGITSDLPVQITDRYQQVTFHVVPGQGGSPVTIVTPETAHIRQGDAVVFTTEPNDVRDIVGAGWTASPLTLNQPIGQIFADSGTFTYRSSAGADGSGAVHVDTLPHQVLQRVHHH